MKSNQHNQPPQTEAPEEQELRRLRGNPRYPRSYLLRWTEPIRFKVLRRKHLLPLPGDLSPGYLGVFVRNREHNRAAKNHFRNDAIGRFYVLVLLIAVGLLKLVMPLYFAIPVVCLLFLTGYVLYRLYIPDRYIVVESDRIRVRYLYEKQYSGYEHYSTQKKNKPVRLQYQEQWLFDAIEYCRPEIVQMSGSSIMCMYIMHKNGSSTYIGVPAEKYIRLLVYILERWGVEVRETVHRNSPAEMIKGRKQQ